MVASLHSISTQHTRTVQVDDVQRTVPILVRKIHIHSALCQLERPADGSLLGGPVSCRSTLKITVKIESLPFKAPVSA